MIIHKILSNQLAIVFQTRYMLCEFILHRFKNITIILFIKIIMIILKTNLHVQFSLWTKKATFTTIFKYLNSKSLFSRICLILLSKMNCLQPTKKRFLALFIFLCLLAEMFFPIKNNLLQRKGFRHVSKLFQNNTFLLQSRL